MTKFKVSWDFMIQTDHENKVKRPDILVVDKTSMDCLIIDNTIPGDKRRIEEEEKIQSC